MQGMKLVQIVIQTAILSVESVNQMGGKFWYHIDETIAFNNKFFYYLVATVLTKVTTGYLVNPLLPNLL